MALFGISRGFTVGFIVGFGAGVVTRDYLPEIRSAFSPLLKTSLRSLLLTMERSRELAARFGEAVQDNWAEVQAEMKAEASGRGPGKAERPARRKRPKVAPVVQLRSTEATQ